MGKKDKTNKRKRSKEGEAALSSIAETKEKRQGETKIVKEDDVNHRQEDHDENDDSDAEEERALLEAAGSWARESHDKGRERETVDRRQQGLSPGAKQQEAPPPFTKPKVFSLHITQLPKKATVSEVWSAFENASGDKKKKALVTSVRFVYDRDHSTGEQNFRGVAFVDLKDELSYNAALKLHETKFKGRTMYVRPTRTKSELEEIVRQTKERVGSYKQKTAQDKFEREQKAAQEKFEKEKKDARRQSKNKNKNSGKEKDDEKTKGQEDQSTKVNTKTKSKNKKMKLDKKEKAKKAAILLSSK
jgi:hypothetical protein